VQHRGAALRDWAAPLPRHDRERRTAGAGRGPPAAGGAVVSGSRRPKTGEDRLAGEGGSHLASAPGWEVGRDAAAGAGAERAAPLWPVPRRVPQPNAVRLWDEGYSGGERLGSRKGALRRRNVLVSRQRID